MNIQQLQYIIAVDEHRHFVKAAAHCFITQATLSMMIKKLEEELDVVIFNRSIQPVQPTPEGEQIIIKARLIMQQVKDLQLFAKELKGTVSGDLRLAVIPTLAPYLLPLFIENFSSSFPHLQIKVKEMLTDAIVAELHAGKIDIGILAVPLEQKDLREEHLFYEPFYAYATEGLLGKKKKLLMPGDIHSESLWLLEEGHCLRNQVFDLCEQRSARQESINLQYEAGSLETLIRMVDLNGGMTIIPHLATLNLSKEQQVKLKGFANPAPVREISMVMHANYPREALVNALKKTILKHIPLLDLSGQFKVLKID
jgi:LysR family hydrogen peroxide-inducible transcriptional activator